MKVTDGGISISYMHRQAITVTYRPATDTRCSGYVAKCQAKPRGVFVGYSYELDCAGNYEASCAALVTALGWDEFGGKWVGGGSPAGDGAVFVWVPVAP